MDFLKKDRLPLDININLDINSIKKYLNEEDIRESDWNVSHSYKITLLPTENEKSIYFHQKNNSFVRCIDATDTIENINIHWTTEKEYFIIRANEKIVFICPIDSTQINIERGGKTNLRGNAVESQREDKELEMHVHNSSEIIKSRMQSWNAGISYRTTCAEAVFSFINGTAFYNGQKN